MTDIDDVARAIGRLEGKQDATHERIDSMCQDMKRVQTDHAKRLGSLERSRSKALGVLSVMSAMFGTGAGFLVNWLKSGS